MLPKYFVRRLRWTILIALASAVWTNRQDASRWWQFARQSVGPDSDGFGPDWWKEARVRLAVTMDSTLRSSTAIDDLEVHGDEVVVWTKAGVWPDVERHLDSVRRVKGVSDVRCQTVTEVPDQLVDTLLNAG